MKKQQKKQRPPEPRRILDGGLARNAGLGRIPRLRNPSHGQLRDPSQPSRGVSHHEVRMATFMAGSQGERPLRGLLPAQPPTNDALQLGSTHRGLLLRALSSPCWLSAYYNERPSILCQIKKPPKHEGFLHTTALSLTYRQVNALIFARVRGPTYPVPEIPFAD